MSSRHRLTRSTDRRIGGVCGGLAHYFDIDPTLVRIGMVFLTIVFPPTMVAYIVAWIVMPEEIEAVVLPAAPRVATPPRT